MAEKSKPTECYFEMDLTHFKHTLQDGVLRVYLTSWDNGIGIKSFVIKERDPDIIQMQSWKYLGVGDRGGLLMW